MAKKGAEPKPKGEHSCAICLSPERDEIERKYLEGWLYRDIVLAHTIIIKTISTLKTHLNKTGLLSEEAESRRTSIKTFCQKVMQATLPMIESGKGLTVSDGLDAVKILARLGTDDRIEEIWRIVAMKGEEIGSLQRGEIPDKRMKILSEFDREGVEYARSHSDLSEFQFISPKEIPASTTEG